MREGCVKDINSLQRMCANGANIKNISKRPILKNL